jgi:hypothetical protein
VPTVAELSVAEELVAIREIAASRGWSFQEVDVLHFRLGFQARDQSRFHLLVDCTGYPVHPPAWHWCDPAYSQTARPADCPGGSGFLHPCGVICAPWNRLAYRSIDPRGPHTDWTIGDWQQNPHTAGCTTLAHMTLRIYVELHSSRFNCRRLG